MSETDRVKDPLDICVLTVSDTRTPGTDTSGDLLAERLQQAGHALVARAIVADDIYRLRAQLSTWIAMPEVQVVLLTGGTGFSHRDSTPEAVRPLLDKEIDGFGELFRHQSWHEIGALAGLANGTLVVCLPGSTGACRTGWELIAPQLDSRYRPCNFVGTLMRAREQRQVLS
jgi:molybdenum cofactor biosynthesis protein B